MTSPLQLNVLGRFELIADGEPVGPIANKAQAMLAQYVPKLMKLEAIAIDIGRQDGLITSNEVFVEELERFHVPHTYETYEGEHSDRVHEPIEHNVLPFFSRHLSFDPQ